MAKANIKLQELTANYEKRIYDLEQMLDISRSFSSTLEASKLLDSIVFSCMAQMHVIDAGIFVLDMLNSDYFVLETNQIILETKNDNKYQIPFEDPIVSILLEEKRPLSLEYIEKKCSSDSETIELLRSMHSSLIIPLILKNHINGILFLGERLIFDSDADAAYTDYEKGQIMTIASLASIAINNSVLLERSSTDMMTKLKLKYFFFNSLTEKLDAAMVQKQPLSILMFDIDFFKHFNDTYGHDCGDYVLKQVASLIKSNLREDDLASRYGGEEFTVMLNETQKEDAISIAERIRTAIENHEFVFNNQVMKVTISCGLSVFDYKKNPLTVPQQLVKQADRGLYMSKHNGRNRVTYAPPSLVSLDDDDE